ncbi:MAG: hypothetical protein FJX76_12560 [Armatimonadetes bacterium]|nr:hypothetical protein [Armatimonadota bacterium]
MKKGAPPRPGQDPTLETALGVVACVVLGIFFVVARPPESADGKPLAGWQAIHTHFPPSAPGKKPPAKKGPTGQNVSVTATTSATPGTPEPSATESAAPSPTAPPVRKGVYQVKVPWAGKNLGKAAPHVRGLFDSTAQVAEAGNALIGLRQMRQVNEQTQVLENNLEALKALRFKNPRWKGVSKKVVATVAAMNKAGLTIFEGLDNDDDEVGEQMERKARAALKKSMQTLQALINSMQAMRRKGLAAKG